MCTSVVVNRKKTIVGFNLDLMNMQHRVRPDDEGVYIEVNDASENIVYWCENRKWDEIKEKKL